MWICRHIFEWKECASMIVSVSVFERTCRGRRAPRASTRRPGPVDGSRCAAASSSPPSEEPLHPGWCDPAGWVTASPSTGRPGRRSSGAGRGRSEWSGPGRRPRRGPRETRGAADTRDAWWVSDAEAGEACLYIEALSSTSEGQTGDNGPQTGGCEGGHYIHNQRDALNLRLLRERLYFSVPGAWFIHASF